MPTSTKDFDKKYKVSMSSSLDELLIEARRNKHTNLYLNYQNLDEIPTAVLEITSVTRLYLKRNLLKSLPPDLSKLTQLVELYLPSNELRYLPDEIGQLETLQCLNVDSNFLTVLPKTFGKLKNLKKLQMSNNELQEIVAEIGELKLLEVIEAINNKLKFLPEELSKCTNLTTLSVDRNNIEGLPESLLKLVKLKELSLSRNYLFRLPHDLDKLCCLESLVVDSNSALLVIPSKIFTIQSLHTLGLNGCGTISGDLMETVMKWFRKIERLREIQGNIPKLFELAARAFTSNRENEMDFLPVSFKRDISSPKGHCFSCSKPYFSSAFIHLGDINEVCRIANLENTNLFSQLRETRCYFAFCFCSMRCLTQVIQ